MQKWYNLTSSAEFNAYVMPFQNTDKFIYENKKHQRCNTASLDHTNSELSGSLSDRFVPMMCAACEDVS